MVCGGSCQLLVGTSVWLLLLLWVTIPCDGSPALQRSYNMVEKRPYKNFLRFGRREPNTNDLSKVLGYVDGVRDSALPVLLRGSPVAAQPYDSLGLALADMYAAKRASANRNFLRFGRGFKSRNFLRFGKAEKLGPRDIVRLGRATNERDMENVDSSYDVHLASPNAYHSDERSIKENRNSKINSNNIDHSLPPMVANPEPVFDALNDNDGTRMDSLHSRSKRDTSDIIDHGTGVDASSKFLEHDISKRAIPHMFAMPHNPSSRLITSDWLSEPNDMAGFHYGEDSSEEEIFPSDAIQEIQKRTFPRSFLRYGREPTDLHFIRFGKRDDISDEMDFESKERNPHFSEPRGELLNGLSRYEQLLLSRNNKNFIRFGR